MCVISLCTRGALDTWSRGRSTAALDRMGRRGSKVLGIILVLGGSAVGWPGTAAFFAVDACLDAGGSFNYTRSVCDVGQSHAYSPTLAHSPWLILLGGAMVLSGVWAIFRRRTRA
jgi:LPXTG-motif cell wall-anchored protein